MTARRAVLLLAVGGVLAGCQPESADAPGRPDGTGEMTGLANGSFTVDLDGFRIHFEVHGQGPVLMTLPNSWGLSLEGLRVLYRPLEGRLTMVYFDPRGMGGSAPIGEEADMGMAAVRDDFDALRRHLGLDRVNAIGWSNGATNLIFLASERPEILESAIILHTVARFSEADNREIAARYPEWVELYSVLGQELASEDLPIEAKNARFKRFNLEVAFANLFADPEAGREILARVWADLEFSFPHTFHAQQELPVYDQRDLLGSITARSLVLAGAKDLLPPARVEEIHAGIADSRFTVFEESGHFAPLEETEAFVASVFEFLGVS